MISLGHPYSNSIVSMVKIQELRIKQLLFEPYEITRRYDRDVKLPYKAMEKTGCKTGGDKQYNGNSEHACIEDLESRGDKSPFFLKIG
jgi:hypothetical protein